MKASLEDEYVAFVAARQQHLRRIAYAICGDWHRAEDLLQTALTKLYLAWPRLRREGAEEAYVRTILVRADIDEHRRPWRRERASATPPDAVAPALPAYEETSALLDALRRLPDMQRRTVLLRHWLGLSVEETATELRISPGTVKSHTSRALESLRSLLVEDTTP
ncbi:MULTISPECIES: SigE family RNA polymerase sigma factor [unclassified Nocardioides]|uniref:SigE family RNA polymerase sigma factor n=1 Tax=unclassified Nocardioides TaxID=2615069 RepID=UPI00362367AE